MDIVPKAGLLPVDFLLPAGIDLQKWSVIACDQFTSEPDYWNRVESFVGNQPSALHAILPEIHLEKPDTEDRILKVNQTMSAYLDQGLFVRHNGYVYIKRILNNGMERKGLLGVIDLEDYSFKAGKSCKALIRSTEGTVPERIPPRVAIRQNAPLEFSHTILLYDDPENIVIDTIESRKNELELLYDFELMENGGHISGWLVDRDDGAEVQSAFGVLSERSPLLFAVGDGNHSLAAAKTCYSNLKKHMPKKKYLVHPARYALVEAINIHDPAMEFEPIHRIVFDIDPDHLISELDKFFAKGRTRKKLNTTHVFRYITSGGHGECTAEDTGFTLPVAALQHFLDYYVSANGGRIDYIHGDQNLETLSSRPGAIGFLLPPIDKGSFFKAVITDGSFPRKTFSCGNAEDKRYYIECRKITL